jgi:hypothetical protein
MAASSGLGSQKKKYFVYAFVKQHYSSEAQAFEGKYTVLIKK